MFYNAIGAVAQCPNNWGVGSVFPTLENTYFTKTMTRVKTMAMEKAMTMAQSLQTNTIRKQGLLNIKTLLTFLTLENNNLNFHWYPSIKSGTGQHS